ncbi:MAG TPA: ATPase domain-containing protein [Candidatus Eisenbacteria bacterium]
MSLAALRQQLSQLVPPARIEGGVIPTGIAALDRELSGGGLPSGRLTEISGARGSGKTSLVRQLVAGALAARRWVAYVDGTRTLAPGDWAPFGDRGRLWVVRPREADRGAWCADVLLRSGAFGMVVLDEGRPLSREVAVRLTRLARERDAALVVVSDGPGGGGRVTGTAVRLWVRRAPDERREAGSVPGGPGGRWPAVGRAPPAESSGAGPAGASRRVLRIVVDKGGRHHSVEVGCAIELARRLCAHPEVPDRRGVATRNRRGERAGPDVPGARRGGGNRGRGSGGGDRERSSGGGSRVPHPARSGSGGRPDAGAERTHPGRTGAGPAVSGSTAAGPVGSTLPRKRRCAEPVVRRDGFLLAGTRRS